ncbi:hypothetical protein [Nonomuraea typhae]|uniref:hypothetical protein n=1 Tax=Nonomuraea typhae TaxID=2603600 RepID=UPI0012F87541|nr:hypothetical protein [Nonomuraea typhae]
MTSVLRLGPEDNSSLQEAGRILYAQGWPEVHTVRNMLAQWEWLGSQVERGYTATLAEYLDDLSCREWLARAGLLVTEPARTLLDQALQPLDTRFQAATEDDGSGVLSGHGQAGRGDGWWWKRIPRRLIGGLAQFKGH